MDAVLYYEVFQVLADCKEEIAEAEERGLALMMDEPRARRIKRLIDLEILNEDSRGSVVPTRRLQDAMKVVTRTRRFEQFNQKQLEQLAMIFVE